jgi:hypothetical protein
MGIAHFDGRAGSGLAATLTVTREPRHGVKNRRVNVWSDFLIGSTRAGALSSNTPVNVARFDISNSYSVRRPSKKPLPNSVKAQHVNRSPFFGSSTRSLARRHDFFPGATTFTRVIPAKIGWSDRSCPTIIILQKPNTTVAGWKKNWEHTRARPAFDVSRGFAKSSQRCHSKISCPLSPRVLVL